MDKKEQKPQKKYNEKTATVVRRTFNVITTVIVALVALFAILIVGVRIFGVQIYIVLSPSMEPEYRTGGLLYVAEVDPDTLEVGDDITFRLSSGTPATHRIIEKVYDENDPAKYTFRTQGIANDDPDENPVLPENILGKAVFHIPYLGYVVDFIQSPIGIYACAAGAIFIMILMLIPDVIFPKETPEKKSKKKKNEGSAEGGETVGAPASETEASEPSENAEGTEPIGPSAEEGADPPVRPAGTEDSVPSADNDTP